MLELKLDEVTKKYKDLCAVDHVEAVFTHGVYGLLGANGAGKTTLLRLMCDILRPDEGEILLDRNPINRLGASYRRFLGYLPQDFGFYPDFTAERFLLYMAALKALPSLEAKRKTAELLAMVGLEDSKNKKIKTFSGGMVRRLGIAQAMLNDPEILILDEPTAGLDPKGRDDILGLVARLHAEQGMTVILVSHSMEDVARYVSRLVVMNHGEKVFDGTPREVFRHYKELEAMGLAAPQITYVVHALRERGIPVDEDITTVEEARDAILALWKKAKGTGCCGEDKTC